MSNRSRTVAFPLALTLALLAAAFVLHHPSRIRAAGPVAAPYSSFRVLAPIESGNLLLFPVVHSYQISASPFLTLDEGLKSGAVEVTEAGRVSGLVRPRPSEGAQRPVPVPPNRGDQVNTLVLLNNSDKPLLLLAGEIVTGGKQDRVIAKDRIVPAGSDPIDLNVFCIEPGRWTGNTSAFTASAKSPAMGLMVQPTVRAKAMVEKDQQEVWNSVHGSINAAARAPAPSSTETVTVTAEATPMLTTSSYAQAMQQSAISAKVDEAAAPVMKSREQVLEKLREEHAVGVIVAVRGEIVWADIFSDPELLARYWTKLVRSYAAESLLEGEKHSAPSVGEAQQFLNTPAGGTETSIGDVGVYRYRELRSSGTETFVLESLLPGTGYDVHISKVKLRGDIRPAKGTMGY